jgi:cytidine deaminase
METKELLRIAHEAATKAHAPYSRFYVGTALLASSGNVYDGCNIENSSYGATICAERVAMVKAVSCGEREFEAIVIVASSKEFTYPCGLCRQFMSEFGINLRIIVEEGSEVREHKLRELLPYAFVAFESTSKTNAFVPARNSPTETL